MGLAEELRPEDEAVRSLHGKAREVSSMSSIVAGVCWKSLMLLGMLSLSFNRSDKGFGYALGIDAVPKAKRRD